MRTGPTTSHLLARLVPLAGAAVVSLTLTASLLTPTHANTGSAAGDNSGSTAGNNTAGTTERLISSTVTHPTGGDVRTEFVEATVTPGRGGWQGTATSLPTSPSSREGATSFNDVLHFDSSDVTTPAARSVEKTIPYQRVDLPWSGEGQSVLWRGQVDSARTIVVSAWDGTRWEELTRSRGQREDVRSAPLTLQAPLAPRHRHASGDSAVAHVLIHALDPFADDISHEVRPGFENPEDYDFSLVHHSDTQYNVRGAVSRRSAKQRTLWKHTVDATSQWIADNAERRKIVAALHTGDLVDRWMTPQDDIADARAEFRVISASQRIIEKAGVVTATVPGNHDNLRGSDTGKKALYNDYFGPDRYERLQRSLGWRQAKAEFTPWRSGDASNSYTTFTAGGLEFIALTLGYGVTRTETAWANRILKAHPNHNAIVMTHAYASPSISPDGRGGGLSVDGARVRKRVVAPNPNVALVLSGHEHGVSIDVRTNAGRKGHHVTELLADYQHYTLTAAEVGLDEGGQIGPDTELRLGGTFLRLLQFDVERSEVSVDTYLPFMEIHGGTSYDSRNRYDGREDDFRVPVQLTSRATSFSTDGVALVASTGTVLGETTLPSGTTATHRWDGLVPGSAYAWQARSVDAATGDPLASEGQESPVVWFTARAGNDTVAPRLSVPGTTTVAHSSEFDALAGVSARDDDGTSLRSRVQVTGAVNTRRSGAQTLHYSVTDAAGNTSLHTRTIVVARAAAPQYVSGARMSGKAVVGRTLRAYRGTWKNLGDAEFTVTWLRNGKKISGATGSTYTLTHRDAGQLVQPRIAARAPGRREALSIPAAVRVTKMRASSELSLAPSISQGTRATLQMRYSHPHAAVDGRVTIRVGSRVVARPRLDADGRATVTLPSLAAGTHTVTVTRPGDKHWRTATAKQQVTVTPAG